MKVRLTNKTNTLGFYLLNGKYKKLLPGASVEVEFVPNSRTAGIELEIIN